MKPMHLWTVDANMDFDSDSVYKCSSLLVDLWSSCSL
jgi:hypothetical protein